MKKLFTLVALLACFLGAKAEWVEDKAIDYSKFNAYPFMVMGFVPEWVDGVMTDLGGNYTYANKAEEDEKADGKSSDVVVKTQNGTEYYRLASEGTWHQYIIATEVPMVLDNTYTVKAVVRASADVSMNLQFGNWGSLKETQVSIPASDDFQEVEWEVTGCLFTGNGFLCAQPNTAATIEWKSLTISHYQKEQRPTTWKEWLTSDGAAVIVESTPSAIPTYVGGAEFGSWPAWALEETDGVNINWRGDKSNEICAWSIVRGKNIDSDQTIDPINTPDGFETVTAKPRPFPCEIMADPDKAGNHLFVVKTTAADNPITDWQAWDNQFFIMSPRPWKTGDLVKVSFKYKAAAAATAQTQIHHKNPSHYKHYVGIGDVNFTTEWQEFSKEITFSEAQGSEDGGWCVAFNLNVDNKDENTFYFDDLSMQTMVLDEGWFVASSNASTGIEYDYDNAVECVYDEGEDAYVGTVGEVGKKDTWVSEVMISTKRGNDIAFKGATIKLTETFKEGEWLGYETATLSKIKLSAAGVWQISVAPGDGLIKFDKLDGEDAKEPVDIVTNPSVLVINGAERQPTSNEQPADPDKGIAEGTGQTWDNQFFIVANRVLEGGEKTVIEFDYVATAPAKVLTGTHAAPGDYRKNAFGDVEFTTEEQHLKKEYEIPSVGWDGSTVLTGMQSISFDMAVIKEANTYTIKNVKWYLANDTEGKTTENLINATGTDNFQVKIGAGNKILPYGSETGIENVAAKSAKTSTVIYNLAGQRVANSFKGIVIKDGKKFVK